MEGTKDTSPSCPPTEIDFAHRTVSGAKAAPLSALPLAALRGRPALAERRGPGFG